MRRLKDNRGFTLVELLTTMSLMIVVIGATTSAFVAFNNNERVNRLHNESNDQARTAVERVSRQLRNLASPIDNFPRAVELAEDYDMVFRTVDDTPRPAGSLNERNIKRVRYCLSPEVGGSSELWMQEQKWVTADPPASYPSTASCPSGAWGNKAVVAQDIVSRAKKDPVFSYTPTGALLTDIQAVQSELFVDVTPGSKAPAATRLASGVFLRNQNRAPVASCSAVATGNGNQIVLNGSASEDPEGRNIIKYEWLLDGKVVDDGVVAIYTAQTPGVYSFQLRVTDYGGLTGVQNCDKAVVIS